MSHKFQTILLLILNIRSWIWAVINYRSDSTLRKRTVPWNSDDFMEATFGAETFSDLSIVFSPNKCSFWCETARIRRHNSEIFRLRVLAPFSMDLWGFPAANGDFSIAFRSFTEVGIIVLRITASSTTNESHVFSQEQCDWFHELMPCELVHFARPLFSWFDSFPLLCVSCQCSVVIQCSTFSCSIVLK